MKTCSCSLIWAQTARESGTFLFIPDPCFGSAPHARRSTRIASGPARPRFVRAISGSNSDEWTWIGRCECGRQGRRDRPLRATAAPRRCERAPSLNPKRRQGGALQHRFFQAPAVFVWSYASGLVAYSDPCR